MEKHGESLFFTGKSAISMAMAMFKCKMVNCFVRFRKNIIILKQLKLCGSGLKIELSLDINAT